MTKKERQITWEIIHKEYLKCIPRAFIDIKYNQCRAMEYEIISNLRKYDIKHNLPVGHAKIFFKQTFEVTDFIFKNDEELAILVEHSNAMLNTELLDTIE